MRNFATGFEEKSGDHWLKSLQTVFFYKTEIKLHVKTSWKTPILSPSLW